MIKKFPCLFLVALLSLATVSAQTVSLKKLTHVKKLVSGMTFPYKGFLYSIYNGAALYKIDLTTGESSQVGTTLYNNTRFLFGLNNHLFIIEKDGSMNQIEPGTGTYRVVSPIGTWLTIDRVVVIGNNFYTIENGALYYHPGMSDRGRKQIGDAEFFDMGIMMYTDTSLHSIISGFLYRIDLTTGKWTKVGSGKNWKYCRAGGVANNKVYTMETPAVLFETNLADGTKKQLDDTHFTNYRGMFSHNGKLYCFTADEDLCEILLEGN